MTVERFSQSGVSVAGLYRTPLLEQPQPDEPNCAVSSAEPEHELFLVYGKGRPGVIRGMDINPKIQDEYMIPIENLMNPRALDFHAQSNYIYFADANSFLIGRQKIDGTERDTILKEGSRRHVFGFPDVHFSFCIPYLTAES